MYYSKLILFYFWMEWEVIFSNDKLSILGIILYIV